MSVFRIVASRPIRKITAAAAVLFFLLLALIPGTLRAQIDSREGIILVVASYNPDTRRMSGFISDFEQAIVQKKVPYEIVVEDMQGPFRSAAMAGTDAGHFGSLPEE